MYVGTYLGILLNKKYIYTTNVCTHIIYVGVQVYIKKKGVCAIFIPIVI